MPKVPNSGNGRRSCCRCTVAPLRLTAVAAKLKARNPKWDERNLVPKIENGVLVSLRVDNGAALHDLEPGRYTVKVWAPEMRGEPSRTVTVTGDERVDVSFNTGR